MKKTVLALAVMGTALSVTTANATQPRHRHHHHRAAQAQSDRGYPQPIYNGQDYLGTDPDPNIRFQIQRDLQSHYR